FCLKNFFNSSYSLCSGAFGLGSEVKNLAVADCFLSKNTHNSVHNTLYIGKASQMFFTSFKKWKRFVVQPTINQSGVKLIRLFSPTINGEHTKGCFLKFLFTAFCKHQLCRSKFCYTIPRSGFGRNAF